MLFNILIVHVIIIVSLVIFLEYTDNKMLKLKYAFSRISFLFFMRPGSLHSTVPQNGNYSVIVQ